MMNKRYQQSDLAKIILDGSLTKLPKGTIIRFDGNKQVLAVLESGYVKRYTITESGDHSVQSIYDAGNIFPLTPAYGLLFDLQISTGIEDVYYETLTPAIMYTLSGDQLVAHMQKNPSLYRDFSYVAGIRLRSNVQRLENASMKSIYKRVVHQLLYLAERYGERKGNVVTLELPLTHQLMANMLNAARESVSHSMAKLQQKGLVSKTPKFTIHDIERLFDEL